MAIDQQHTRKEVERAEELLDLAEQKVRNGVLSAGQAVFCGPRVISRAIHSGLDRVRTLGKQAGEPARSVAGRIRRNESPQTIDLNTASAEELETISGIGPVLARRIIDRRNEVGPYTSIDDLSAVSGLSGDVIEEASRRLSIGDTAEQPSDESS